jgi:DNA-binding transcriptional LysR family regulator
LALADVSFMVLSEGHTHDPHEGVERKPDGAVTAERHNAAAVFNAGKYRDIAPCGGIRPIAAVGKHRRHDQPHLPAVTATPLFAETLVVVVGTTTPAEPLTAQAIGHHPLALLTPDFATRGHIDAYLAEHRVTPRIAMETNSIQVLIEIVRRTPLATVLPDAIAHQHPHLSPVALDPPFPTRIVTLLTREGAYQSAANRAFSDLTHEYVRAHLPNNR